ncbi:DUF3422 family protein [Pseudahrensia aquimaris]|uniref:DUF3422 family protein n=1 Tax=Pseudahrensia aquimaris TaxID=744461 RepID=A0ABW3FH09_9HYPH
MDALNTSEMNGLQSRFFDEDPRRALIDAERHARPPLPIEAPAVVQYIALQSQVTDLASERRACLTICENLGLMPSSELTDQIQAVGEGVFLKWERHTEFCSYTIVQQNVEDRKGFVPWSERELGWEDVTGNLLVSLVIGIETKRSRVWKQSGMFDWANPLPLCASLVMSGTTQVESDMTINERGFTRYLVTTSNKEPTRIGRLVQRLIEIESYGAFCLYAWKDVKEIGPKLGEAERRLESITTRLAKHAGESDEQMLDELSEVSAFQEEVTTRSHFRLNASLAYYEIVQRRLEELREERIEGCQRLANFIQRRMNPAARTYRSILKRQAETADRTSRATQLLRGRIEVEIGKQNQQLLKSMNERAEAQYKLQKTVEGLSTVAITYYALGILAYIAAAIAGYVPGLGVKEIVGLAVPFVLLTVWLALKRLRK